MGVGGTGRRPRNLSLRRPLFGDSLVQQCASALLCITCSSRAGSEGGTGPGQTYNNTQTPHTSTRTRAHTTTHFHTPSDVPDAYFLPRPFVQLTLACSAVPVPRYKHARSERGTEHIQKQAGYVCLTAPLRLLPMRGGGRCSYTRSVPPRGWVGLDQVYIQCFRPAFRGKVRVRRDAIGSKLHCSA
jgi:hypothetical protein